MSHQDLNLVESANSPETSQIQKEVQNFKPQQIQQNQQIHDTTTTPQNQNKNDTNKTTHKTEKQNKGDEQMLINEAPQNNVKSSETSKIGTFTKKGSISQKALAALDQSPHNSSSSMPLLNQLQQKTNQTVGVNERCHQLVDESQSIRTGKTVLVGTGKGAVYQMEGRNNVQLSQEITNFQKEPSAAVTKFSEQSVQETVRATKNEHFICSNVEEQQGEGIVKPDLQANLKMQAQNLCDQINIAQNRGTADEAIQLGSFEPLTPSKSQQIFEVIQIQTSNHVLNDDSVQEIVQEQQSHQQNNQRWSNKLLTQNDSESLFTKALSNKNHGVSYQQEARTNMPKSQFQGSQTSLQQTKSAAETHNLVQQCTEPSDFEKGNHEIVDSQLSSFFRQNNIEPQQIKEMQFQDMVIGLANNQLPVDAVQHVYQENNNNDLTDKQVSIGLNQTVSEHSSEHSQAAKVIRREKVTLEDFLDQIYETALNELDFEFQQSFQERKQMTKEEQKEYFTSLKTAIQKNNPKGDTNQKQSRSNYFQTPNFQTQVPQNGDIIDQNSNNQQKIETQEDNDYVLKKSVKILNGSEALASDQNLELSQAALNSNQMRQSIPEKQSVKVSNQSAHDLNHLTVDTQDLPAEDTLDCQENKNQQSKNSLSNKRNSNEKTAPLQHQIDTRNLLNDSNHQAIIVDANPNRSQLTNKRDSLSQPQLNRCSIQREVASVELVTSSTGRRSQASRISCRFSKGFDNELERVAERITSSVDLNRNLLDKNQQSVVESVEQYKNQDEDIDTCEVNMEQGTFDLVEEVEKATLPLKNQQEESIEMEEQMIDITMAGTLISNQDLVNASKLSTKKKKRRKKDTNSPRKQAAAMTTLSAERQKNSSLGRQERPQLPVHPNMKQLQAGKNGKEQYQDRGNVMVTIQSHSPNGSIKHRSRVPLPVLSQKSDQIKAQEKLKQRLQNRRTSQKNQSKKGSTLEKTQEKRDTQSSIPADSSIATTGNNQNGTGKRSDLEMLSSKNKPKQQRSLNRNRVQGKNGNGDVIIQHQQSSTSPHIDLKNPLAKRQQRRTETAQFRKRRVNSNMKVFQNKRESQQINQNDNLSDSLSMQMSQFVQQLQQVPHASNTNYSNNNLPQSEIGHQNNLNLSNKGQSAGGITSYQDYLHFESLNEKNVNNFRMIQQNQMKSKVARDVLRSDYDDDASRADMYQNVNNQTQTNETSPLFNASISVTTQSAIAGLTPKRIARMPVEDIYGHINKTLETQKSAFETRCNQVLILENQRKSHQGVSIEEIKRRKEKFDKLKSRLMNNINFQPQQDQWRAKAGGTSHDAENRGKDSVEEMLEIDPQGFQFNQLIRQFDDLNVQNEKSQNQMIKPQILPITQQLKSQKKEVNVLKRGILSMYSTQPQTLHKYNQALQRLNQSSEYQNANATQGQKGGLQTILQTQPDFQMISNDYSGQKTHAIQSEDIWTPRTNFSGVIVRQNNQRSNPSQDHASFKKKGGFFNNARSHSNVFQTATNRNQTWIKGSNDNFLNQPSQTGINNDTVLSTQNNTFSASQSQKMWAQQQQASKNKRAQTQGRASTAHQAKRTPAAFKNILAEESPAIGLNSTNDLSGAQQYKSGDSQFRYTVNNSSQQQPAVANQQAKPKQLQSRAQRGGGHRFQDLLERVQSRQIPIADLSQNGQMSGEREINQHLHQQQKQLTETNLSQRGHLFTPTSSRDAFLINRQNRQREGSKEQQLTSFDPQSVDFSLNAIDSHQNMSLANKLNSTEHLLSSVANSSSNQINLPYPDSNILSRFLAQQDKRVDFGQCKLNQKVFANNMTKDNDLIISNQEINGQQIMSKAALERVISTIKKEKGHLGEETAQLDKKEQLASLHDQILTTLQFLMEEVGLGSRAKRMIREANAKTVERIFVLACRAHKVYRARSDLVSIFKLVQKAEMEIPNTKKLLKQNLSQISSSNNLVASQQRIRNLQRIASDLRSESCSGGVLQNPTENRKFVQQDNEQMLTVDEQMKQQLVSCAGALRDLISQIVVRVAALLDNYKFFNSTFVFNEKDYMKHLSKETNELKGLFRKFEIEFE